MDLSSKELFDLSAISDFRGSEVTGLWHGSELLASVLESSSISALDSSLILLEDVDSDSVNVINTCPSSPPDPSLLFDDLVSVVLTKVSSFRCFD